MDQYGSCKVAGCLNYTFSNPILMFCTHTRSSMGLMMETEVGLECFTGKDTIIRMEVFDWETKMVGFLV